MCLEGDLDHEGKGQVPKWTGSRTWNQSRLEYLRGQNEWEDGEDTV